MTDRECLEKIRAMCWARNSVASPVRVRELAESILGEIRKCDEARAEKETED